MMYWTDGSWGWGGWLVMVLSMAVFWGLLIWVALVLTRSVVGTDRVTGSGRPPGTPTPEDVLADRFARGDIDEDEYRRRSETLRAVHTKAR